VLALSETESETEAESDTDAGTRLGTTDGPTPEPQRINMVAAIRRTLESELAADPRVLVFGEDVGPKGGVHAATQGLQERFGTARVFDTSLSEEGIIGRAVGFALAGLKPCAEIQFRKYADPATEQLFNCGTIRWRTNNRFAAPIVVRMPGGFSKIGDPWHSVSNEVMFVHAIGWRVAMPSNAEDAVGLLRTAIRGHDPVIFFEHRQLLDAANARRGYPGDDYALPFGKAATLTTGSDLTVVTWGAMVARCLEAAGGIEQDGQTGDKQSAGRVEVIDLRTLSPWDEHTVLTSVRRTRRCLVVHEDGFTAGFGAEVAATISNKLFLELDAPVSRIAVPDVPIPHNRGLMESILPDVDSIRATMTNLIEF
jgi:2-oxoisovalerate dehydrogenase E1 component